MTTATNNTFTFNYDPAETADLEMGMDILSFSAGLLNGYMCAALYSMFSTVWLGVIITALAFILGTLAIVAGVTYAGIMHTSAVESIGAPVNAAISRVRGWFK